MRVCHATLSDVLSDQRVMRAAEAAELAGHDVSFAGYNAGVAKRVFTLPRKLMIAGRQLPSHLTPDGWSSLIYWSNPECRELMAAIRKTQPEIIHAHDWEALPAAAIAAREFGARLIYDSHEFAQDMRGERALWRLTFSRFIRGTERRFMGAADRIVTVGERLADELVGAYGLAERPLVVRNVPHYRKLPLKKTDREAIQLHYHGNIRSGLGGEFALQLLARLPRRFSLRFVGREVEPGYVAKLKATAAGLGCADRVVVQDAVPFEELFPLAAEADIGIFLNEMRLMQHTVLAPNKLYEYLMSGLMVAAGPGGDFQYVIEDSGAGLFLESSDPEAVAGRLEALTAQEIEAYKRAALEAAPRYSWEEERKKLIGLYDELAARPGSGAAEVPLTS